jgi:hypothetical protein
MTGLGLQLFVGFCAGCAAIVAMNPAQAGPEFQSLIPGGGWGKWSGLPSHWTIDEGVITGHASRETALQTFLILTEPSVADFELRLKYRFLTDSGNSGVQFRSVVLNADQFRVGGYQADIDATADVDGSFYNEAQVAGPRANLSRRGERAVWTAPDQRSDVSFAKTDSLRQLIKLRDWNEMTISARGQRFQYFINGSLMTEFTDLTEHRLTSGLIALQLHEGMAMEVQFKEIWLKVLDRAP